MECNAPHLRSLRLHEIQLPAPTVINLLSDLTSLILVNQGRVTTPLPSFRDILLLLSRSSRLTTLQLDKYWHESEIEANTLTAGPAIVFPHLERLKLNGGTDYLTALLKSAVIPPTTSLEFSLHDACDALRIRKFIVPLRRLLHRPGVPTFRSLCIEGTPSVWFRLSANTSNYCTGIEDPEEVTHLKIATRPRSVRQVRNILTKLLHMLPLPTPPDCGITLNACNVIGHDDCSMETWKTIGRLLPQLKTVYIEVYDAMVIMLRGLLAAMEGGTKGVSGRRWQRIATKTPLNPSTLSLIATLRQYSSSKTTNKERYEALVDFLMQYRDMDTAGKPKGNVWERIEFEPITSQQVFDTVKDYLPWLAELTGTLTYSK